MAERPDPRDVTELADEDVQEELNPDPTTRREAVEQELLEEDASELGEQIGDQID